MQTVLPLVNLYFDPERDGYDVSTWATLSGTPQINGSNLLELNASSIIGLADFTRCQLEMTITVPHAPASGDVREWGLYQLNNSGAATFKITDDDLITYVCDSDGNTQSDVIEQETAWFTTAAKFTIIYSSGAVKFLINGQQVAIYQGVGVPSGPMSIYVNNEYADSFTLEHYQLEMADVHFPVAIGGSVEVLNSRSLPSPAPTYTLYQNDALESAVVKATPGHVYSLSVTNTTTSTRYFQLHNSPTAPASGAAAEFRVFLPQLTSVGIGTDIFGSSGFSLTSGISVANSTTATTYTAGSAGDLVLDLFYDGGSSTTYLLLENGFNLLIETGDLMLQE